MRLAATKISFEKLHESLNLSEDVHIDDIFLNNDDRYMRTVHVVISGDNPVIPEHQEGSQMATNPLYHFQSMQPLYGLGYMQPIDRMGFYQGLRRFI